MLSAWHRVLGELAADLRADTYRPSPVRGVAVPKPDGRTRLLGKPPCATGWSNRQPSSSSNHLRGGPSCPAAMGCAPGARPPKPWRGAGWRFPEYGSCLRGRHPQLLRGDRPRQAAVAGRPGCLRPAGAQAGASQGWCRDAVGRRGLYKLHGHHPLPEGCVSRRRDDPERVWSFGHWLPRGEVRIDLMVDDEPTGLPHGAAAVAKPAMGMTTKVTPATFRTPRRRSGQCHCRGCRCRPSLSAGGRHLWDCARAQTLTGTGARPSEPLLQGVEPLATLFLNGCSRARGGLWRRR